METTTTIRMRADWRTIFGLAANTPNWPTILPHYRWVHVLAQSGDGAQRTLEMAASRDGIPVRWVAEQVSLPEQHRIEFRHIRGVTRGMQVAWVLSPDEHGTVVSIWHGFEPHWPLVPDALTHLVVGEFFVDNIARKTLHRIRDLADGAREFETAS